MSGNVVLESLPAHMGVRFTPTLHQKAEGPTDPGNNKGHGNLVVVVTGAGKGLGYRIALAYAHAGAKGIVISSRTQADLDRLTAEIESINPNIQVLSRATDVTKDADIRDLAERTRITFGRLDVVVANAGIISKYITKSDGKEYIPAGIVEDDDFENVMDTNLMGTYRAAKHFVPLLKETKDGVQAFVAITSITSHLSNSTFCPVAYNLSKIGITRMVEHIHSDHFGGDGVQAFAVHPGSVLTPQTEAHHTTQLGDLWREMLADDIGLCGGFLTWLTREKRPWLSGRYVSANWDVEELERKKGDIVGKDLLTFRMLV